MRWVGRHQHPAKLFAGKSPGISYSLSHYLATFIPDLEGEDLVGIQRGWTPIDGAELSLTELFELRVFSLHLQAVPGVPKLPPHHAWLNRDRPGNWGLSVLWRVTACRARDRFLGLSFP